MTTEKQPEAAAAAQQTISQGEDVKNLDGLLSKNRELLDEKKKLQQRLTDFEKKQEEIERLKLVEDGKLKEALDKSTAEINRLKTYEEKIKKQEEFYSQQLADEIKELPENLQKLITGFNGEPWEKVSYAKHLKSDFKQSKPAIGAERPGGISTATIDVTQYRGSNGAAKLLDLKYSKPDDYKLVMEILKKGG